MNWHERASVLSVPASSARIEDVARGEVVWAVYGHLDDGKTLVNLRPDERRKIACGRKHFETLGTAYRVLERADELE